MGWQPACLITMNLKGLDEPVGSYRSRRSREVQPKAAGYPGSTARPSGYLGVDIDCMSCTRVDPQMACRYLDCLQPSPLITRSISIYSMNLTREPGLYLQRPYGLWILIPLLGLVMYGSEVSPIP